MKKMLSFVPAALLVLLPACTTGSANTYTNKDLENLPPPPTVKVYTNKDLENLPAATPDEAAIEVATARVAALSARVDELGNRLLAIRNPFWPRPQLEPEEAQAWAGLDGKARAERVEQQLAQARAELAAAEELGALVFKRSAVQRKRPQPMTADIVLAADGG